MSSSFHLYFLHYSSCNFPLEPKGECLLESVLPSCSSDWCFLLCFGTGLSTRLSSSYFFFFIYYLSLSLGAQLTCFWCRLCPLPPSGLTADWITFSSSLDTPGTFCWPEFTPLEFQTPGEGNYVFLPFQIAFLEDTKSFPWKSAHFYSAASLWECRPWKSVLELEPSCSFRGACGPSCAFSVWSNSWWYRTVLWLSLPPQSTILKKPLSHRLLLLGDSFLQEQGTHCAGRCLENRKGRCHFRCGQGCGDWSGPAVRQCLTENSEKDIEGGKNRRKIWRKKKMEENQVFG